MLEHRQKSRFLRILQSKSCISARYRSKNEARFQRLLERLEEDTLDGDIRIPFAIRKLEEGLLQQQPGLLRKSDDAR